MVSRLRIPIVIDPVLKAGTGATLLREDAVKSLLDRLIPISTLVTPNIAEAEFLSGKKILTLRDATDAARNILNKGAKNVIVKGGHLKGKTSTDVLVESTGRIMMIKNSRIDIGETHGSGCNFSAAVTAFLARGFSVHHSCLMAGQYVREALRGATPLGKGHPISMPRSFTTITPSAT
jgi:hydroxymethylpyrimidine/phosphomethylpyrimidine kinase